MINSPLGVQVGEDLIVKKIMPDISYRPLQDSVRLELVNQLSSVHESSLDHAIKLSVSYEIGNIGRQRVTEELVDILKSAGFEIDGPSSQSTYFASNSGIPKAITIGINRDDLEMFKAIFKPLQSFLKVRFPFDMRNEHAKGIISINIYGEPLFADDGTVTFPYYLPQ
jgi:hypothetical protein